MKTLLGLFIIAIAGVLLQVGSKLLDEKTKNDFEKAFYEKFFRKEKEGR